jgi:hypothetical protein
VAGIDAEVGDQLACECRDEPYVVDPLPVGLRRTAAVGTKARCLAVAAATDLPCRSTAQPARRILIG